MQKSSKRSTRKASTAKNDAPRLLQNRRSSISLGSLALVVALVVATGLYIVKNSHAATSAPFTAIGNTWCPTYHANQGCDNIQSPTSPAYNIPFNPAQVAVSGRNGYINLTMTQTGTGAVNTQTLGTYPIGSHITERLNLPCTSSGQIAGWPAFWTDGTTGTWPTNGEIDIAEGLHGQLHYGIHFTKKDGTEGSLPTASQGNIYPGNNCGVHTYGIVWDSTKVAFYKDGNWVNKVTASQMGVPMFSDRQNVINDYGSGAAGGPDIFPSMMQVQSFTHS